MQELTLAKEINSRKDISNRLPLLARSAYNRIRGKQVDDIAVDAKVAEICRNMSIQRLAKIGGAVICNFSIGGIHYNYANLNQALIKNFRIAKTQLSEVQSIIIEILNALADPVNTLEAITDLSNQTPCPALAKYIEYLESQTHKGIWSDIMRFPIDNVQQGLKKHLMIGFNSNTGKSIIINSLYKLYEQVAIMKGNRPHFEFSAGQWNAQVIKSFLVLIDDDNENEKVDEDFIKNFLNEKMPLQLASQSQRWSDYFHGSTVIATNSEENFFHDPQHDKRIALVRLDNPMVGFTNDELIKLHSLTLPEIAYYIEPRRDNPLLYQKNKWDDDTEEIADQIRRYLRLKIAVPNRQLCNEFGKKEVKQALGKAETITFQGKTFYGYRYQNDIHQDINSDEFKVAVYSTISTKKPEIQNMTLEELKKCIETCEPIPKDEQPAINLTVSDTAKEETFHYANGLILDIDKSNFDSLAKIELNKTYIAYETSSSNVNGNGLRYRLIVPFVICSTPEEWKQQCLMLADEIGETVDKASLNVVHRFYVGGKNVIIHRNHTMSYSEEQNRALLNTVQNAEKGQRNKITFWALNRAAEQNNQELMAAILAVSPADKREKENFAKRFLKGGDGD